MEFLYGGGCRLLDFLWQGHHTRPIGTWQGGYVAGGNVAPRRCRTFAHSPLGTRSIMLDILMLAIGCASFGVAILYARACGGL